MYSAEEIGVEIAGKEVVGAEEDSVCGEMDLVGEEPRVLGEADDMIKCWQDIVLEIVLVWDCSAQSCVGISLNV